MKNITLLFTALVLFSVDLIYAQTPANDTCDGAIVLTVGDFSCNNTEVTLDNTATDSGELPVPECADYQGGDLWYKLVMPSTGGVHIETSETDGSIDDGGLAIYTGTCGSLELYACTDDTNPIDTTMEAINVAHPEGETIYIRLWTYGGSQIGTFNICVEKYTPAPEATNDDCVNATPLELNSTCITTLGSNNATNSELADPTIPHPSTDEDCGYYRGRDVWYSIPVPTSGRLALETSEDDGSIQDTGMAVYSGTCDPDGLTFEACNDDASGSTTLFSRIELTGRTPGEMLYVRVWSYGNEELGTFNICGIELPTLSTNKLDIDYFSASPNPAKDFVNLKFNRVTSESMTIQIYNLQGKLVLNTSQEAFNNNVQLNVSNLFSGLYFLKIIDGYRELNKKLIISK